MALDALKTALLTFALCVPIVALRTEQDMSNRLILVSKWGLVAGLLTGRVRRCGSPICWRARRSARPAEKAAGAASSLIERARSQRFRDRRR